MFELLGSGGHAAAALLGGEQVGLQRRSADRGATGGVGWLSFVNLLEEVVVAVEEAAVEVSRSWLYTQSDIKDQIQQLRALGDRAPKAPMPS